MVSGTTGQFSPPAGTTLSQRLRDAAWLLALAIFQVVGTTGAARDLGGRRAPDLIAYLLLLAGPALLALRRRWPVAVLAGVVLVTVAYFSAGYVYGPIIFSAVFALIWTEMAGHRVAAWLLGGLGLAASLVAHGFYSGVLPSLAATAAHVAWLLLVLAIGEIIRIQRSRAEETRRALAEAERRRLSEQRLRIAQDLHDLLGHNMSLINVQASAALHLMDREPERARMALTAIKEASRGTLHEVRDTLNVLRGQDGLRDETQSDGSDREPEAREPAPRQPVPNLVRLSDLQTQFGAAGLEVSVDTEGHRVELPPTVDVTAYRIVQESLTNVLRHSRARAAEVVLGYGPDSLTLSIIDFDPGLGPVSNPVSDLVSGAGGTGILGMRERAASIGGSLTAGPLPGGGFRVVATLPYST